MEFLMQVIYKTLSLSILVFIGLAGYSVFALDTFTTTQTQANATAVSEVKASRSLNIPTRTILTAESFTIGSCVVTFQIGDVDETNCSDNAATISSNVSFPRTGPQIEAVLAAFTNVSDPDHGALSVSASSSNVVFTTTNTEISATPINFVDNTVGNVVSVNSRAGVIPVTAVARVVDFTPAASTAANTTYTATINSTNYEYTTVDADSVQTIVEALQPLMDANAAVNCTEDDTKITCVSNTAGVDFTATSSVITDATAPVFSGMGVGAVGSTGFLTHIREGQNVIIQVFLQDADTAKADNNIVFSIGVTDDIEVTNTVGTTMNRNTHQVNYEVPAGHNGTFSFTGLTFLDQYDNAITGFNSPVAPDTNVIVDTTSPVVTFTDNVEAGPVFDDTIEITVADTNANTTSYEYGFSADATCNASDTFGNPFTSGTPFTISLEGNNGNYICVKAEDLATNISFLSSANPLNINNNRAPTINDATFSVNENSANGTSVGAQVATDPDTTVPNNTLRYSITSGNTNNAFTIGTNTAQITVANSAALDFETTPSYNLTIQANDGGTPSLFDTAMITINVSDINEAPVITSTNTFSADENQTAVTTLTVADEDSGDTPEFSTTLTGTDAGAFNLTTNGVLTFRTAPNFETQSSYSITVTATDGALSATQAITVNVIDVNEAPVISGGASASYIVGENQTQVAILTSTDVDAGQGQTFSQTLGGDDADALSISSDGVLRFNTAPDFETDATTYSIIVTATDGALTDTQMITITVTDVNEAPVITGGATASYNVGENQTQVTTLTVADVDAGDTPEFSTTLTGTDTASFNLTNAGVLTFNTAPDFETDATTYSIIVTATDGALIDTQTIAITVTNVNEAPVITSTNTFSADENQTQVATLTSTDVDAGQGQTFAQNLDGADATAFSLTTDGVLTFNTAPDFETQSSYSIIVTATDGDLLDTQMITIAVTDINEAPVITGGATASYNVGENQTQVTTLTVADVDAGDTPEFSITLTGTDAALFNLTNAGVLTFNTAPDFETQSSYSIIVTATDGDLLDTQMIAITVTNVNEAPVITSTNTFSADENQTQVATLTSTDSDAGQGQTFAQNLGGADAGAFNLTTDGVLTFNTAPDFETQSSYSIIVTATDGALTDTQMITITVNDINEAPVITGGATASYNVGENQTQVTTLTVADEDSGDTPEFSTTLTGTDAALFNLTNAGVLTFNTAPDFETQSSYSIIVTATDGDLLDTQMIAITVTNVDEAPVISGGATASYNVDENQTAVATLTSTDSDAGQGQTFSTTLAGANAAAFSLTSAGVLTFNTAPDFETQSSYSIIVTATDGTLTDTQMITITVNDVNEAPVITSANTFTVNENQRAVTILTAADEDSGDTVAFSFSTRPTGTDTAAFSITTNGVLTFNAAPDFETQSSYLTIVAATDGDLTVTQTIAITVNDVNEAPVISGGATASYNVDENQTQVATLTVADEDPSDAPVFSTTLTGTHADLFNLTSAGVLTFRTAFNFEMQSSYSITATATDNALTDTQMITITVNDINEPPVITSTNTFRVREGLTAVATVMATDEDSGDTVAFSFSTRPTGTDTAAFSITTNGVLTFNDVPNFEAQSSYLTIVAATDGDLTVTQTIAVNIANLPPTLADASRVFSNDVPATETATLFLPNSGDAPTSCTSSPELPSGLSIEVDTDAMGVVTCALSGSPFGVESQSATDYIISADDGFHTGTSTLTIEIISLLITDTDTNQSLRGDATILSSDNSLSFRAVQSVTFTVNGDRGERLSSNVDGSYTFIPPNTNAFAGVYTITVSDANDNVIDSFDVHVPPVIRLDKAGIFERGLSNPSASDNSAVLTISGLSPAASVSLSLSGDNSLAASIDSSAMALNNNFATATFSSISTSTMVETITPVSISAQYRVAGASLTATTTANVLPVIEYSATVIDSSNADAPLSDVLVTSGNVTTTTGSNGIFTLLLATGDRASGNQIDLARQGNSSSISRALALSTYANNAGVAETFDFRQIQATNTLTVNLSGLPSATTATITISNANGLVVAQQIATTSADFTLVAQDGYSASAQPAGYLLALERDIGLSSATATATSITLSFTQVPATANNRYQVSRSTGSLTFSAVNNTGDVINVSTYIVTANTSPTVTITDDVNGDANITIPILEAGATTGAGGINPDEDVILSFATGGETVFTYRFIASSDAAITDDAISGSRQVGNNGFTAEFTQTTTTSPVNFLSIDTSNSALDMNDQSINNQPISATFVALTPVALTNQADSRATGSDNTFFRLDVTAQLADGTIVSVNKAFDANNEIGISMAYDTELISRDDWLTGSYVVYHANTAADLEAGRFLDIIRIGDDNIDLVNGRISFEVDSLSGFTIGEAAAATGSGSDGGCSLNSNPSQIDKHIDPMLYLLLSMALLGLFRKRILTKFASAKP